jgi:di/tricarboxylate transporter
MPWEAWYTAMVLGLMFWGLMRDWWGADVLVLGALMLLWVAGIVSTQEALSGFASAGLMTVAFLFVASQALQDTGALGRISELILGNEARPRGGMARMVFSIAGLSAFVNNTPLVAILTPAVRDWAQRRNLAPSRFLIPVSYASIVGGTCTLVGTSTNLVVSSLLEQNGEPAMGMFELTPLGVPVALAGAFYLLTVGRRLLPDRRPSASGADVESREYSARLWVQDDCPLVGRTVEEAGLRALTGLYLAEIERGVGRIAPVRPTDRIEAGDRLVLYGVTDTVVELRKIRGLLPVDEADRVDSEEARPDRHLFEAVISSNSPLVGSTLKDASFRRRYDAAVIAIQRNGERVRQKLGEVVLATGDTLLLESSRGFRAVWGQAADFYLVSEVPRSERPRHRWGTLSLVIMGAMVVAMGTGLAEPPLAALVAATLLIVTGCVSPASARRGVDLSVLAVIGAAFGVSAAVRNSGLADAVAEAVVMMAGTSPLWMLLGIYLITALFTEVLTNNAAAALAVPLAFSLAARMGEATGVQVDPRPFVMAVAIAASTAFITPIGYATNLMVYGPGGYRFRDFVRVGVPMWTVCCITALITIRWVYGL